MLRENQIKIQLQLERLFDFSERGFLSCSDAHEVPACSDNASACSEMPDKCVVGVKLVTTHLAFQALIVGDDLAVLITCSITANVNKGLHRRPVTAPVWGLQEEVGVFGGW